MKHREVDPAIDNITHRDLRTAGGFGQQFLSQRLGWQFGLQWKLSHAAITR
jgi:hypothetical protein